MTIEPEVAKCFFICTAVVLTAWAVAFGSRRRTAKLKPAQTIDWKWGSYPSEKKGGEDD